MFKNNDDDYLMKHVGVVSCDHGDGHYYDHTGGPKGHIQMMVME